MRRGAGAGAALIATGLVCAALSDPRGMDLLGAWTPLGRHAWFWQGFQPVLAILGLALIAGGIGIGAQRR